ncbi:Uncharacterised protein [Lysinibacillus sphaericus]|nr:Uncharacterised protein [Lysinibacillus sphaericus]
MKEKKCKHIWKDVNDRTYDQICIKCGIKQMQNAMSFSSIPATSSVTQPILRETMEVPFYTGSDHVRLTVYKDDLMKQFRNEQGLSIFQSAGR